METIAHIMSNFSFSHNIFKIGLLQMRQNEPANASGKRVEEMLSLSKIFINHDKLLSL